MQNMPVFLPNLRLPENSTCISKVRYVYTAFLGQTGKTARQPCLFTFLRGRRADFKVRATLPRPACAWS